jgi:RNA polymerase sigma-70 factor (ECF subfamily)
VIELAFFQALPYTEIARLLDIPVGTVKSRVHHAVRKLRELLSEDLES